MKIGVNLFPLRPQIAGGIEIIIRNLLGAMFQQDRDHSYTLITAPWNHEELDYGPGPYRKIRMETDPPPGMLGRLRAQTPELSLGSLPLCHGTGCGCMVLSDDATRSEKYRHSQRGVGARYSAGVLPAIFFAGGTESSSIECQAVLSAGRSRHYPFRVLPSNACGQIPSGSR